MSERPSNLVHCDVWGVASFASKEGHRYYVIFIDDFSRYIWLYFMTYRSEVLSICKRFAAMVHTQFSTPIREFPANFAQKLLDFLAE
jgi:histone deacetylase 1/2